MRLISARAWVLVVLSAGLQVAIFPIAGPVPSWRSALCWIALVPLLVAILSLGRDGKPLTIPNTAYLGYFCGILWYTRSCYWIYQTMYLYGGLPKPVAFSILILFALYLGLYHALFAILIMLARRLNISAALCFSPFAWITVELARARVTGFPWDLLGNSQVDNHLVTRIAPVAGVMAISFFIVAVNAAAAHMFLSPRTRRTYSISAFLALLLLLLTNADMHDSEQAKGPAFAVMMQENLAVGAPGREVTQISSGQEILQFSQLSSHPGHTFKSADADLSFLQLPPATAPTVIIWPEAPSHFQSNDPTFRSAMAQLARAEHAPLIIGSLGVDFDSTPSRGYYLYDSASLFDATGAYRGRYDKIHLVPWGEYIPFKRFFAFARKLTEGVGDMDPGRDRTVFTTGGHTYGVFVCYESIFGDEVRRFAQNGAQVLVQISDDGWYGDTGAPWQHLNMARMRAIENHRWLLRSTNTGITTAIDPLGRTSIQAPRHIRAAFAFPFTFEQGTTFYTRHGDWFAWLCAAITLCSIAPALWLSFGSPAEESAVRRVLN